jgi:hypothetical protein
MPIKRLYFNIIKKYKKKYLREFGGNQLIRKLCITILFFILKFLTVLLFMIFYHIHPSSSDINLIRKLCKVDLRKLYPSLCKLRLDYYRVISPLQAHFKISLIDTYVERVGFVEYSHLLGTMMFPPVTGRWMNLTITTQPIRGCRCQLF